MNKIEELLKKRKVAQTEPYSEDMASVEYRQDEVRVWNCPRCGFENMSFGLGAQVGGYAKGQFEEPVCDECGTSYNWAKNE